MNTIAVQLTSEELGLLRAGLAAHAIALSGNPPRPTPKETETILETMKGNFHRVEVSKKQREACRELSIRLGDAQIALYEQGA